MKAARPRGKSRALEARTNRMRPLSVPAPRGTIYDRHGQIVAENQAVVRYVLGSGKQALGYLIDRDGFLPFGRGRLSVVLQRLHRRLRQIALAEIAERSERRTTSTNTTQQEPLEN